MPIELACTGCGRQLRVADEHAGKALRCPACGQIGRAEGTPPAASDSWHMRTPEGHTYGPVERQQLTQWAHEGRLTSDCQLARHPGGAWQSASSVVSNLPPAPPRAQPQPVALTPQSPFASTAMPQFGAAGRYVEPHRGPLILILGILGFFINCPIFSFMAWVMASQDLRLMRDGRMDRSGEGLTQAGYYLGMIWSMLWIVAAVVIGMVLIFAAAAGN